MIGVLWIHQYWYSYFLDSTRSLRKSIPIYHRSFHSKLNIVLFISIALSKVYKMKSFQTDNPFFRRHGINAGKEEKNSRPNETLTNLSCVTKCITAFRKIVLKIKLWMFTWDYRSFLYSNIIWKRVWIHFPSSKFLVSTGSACMWTNIWHLLLKFQVYLQLAKTVLNYKFSLGFSFF